MNPLYPYPKEIPTKECVDLVVKALRGQFDPKESAHAVWVLLGFALSQWDKHSPILGVSNLTHGDAARMLETAVAGELSAVPWSVLIPILLDLIQKILKR